MRIVGVLAIIFASLGLISALSPLALPHAHVMWSGLSPYARWVTVWAMMTAAISGLHLAGGIQTVRGHRSGPRLLMIYGIAALALIAVDVGMSFATWHGSLVGSHFDLQVAPRLALDVVSLPWPIVVLAVIARRRSR